MVLKLQGPMGVKIDSRCQEAIVGLKPPSEFNPTKCPKCESADIIKKAEQLRGPIVMTMEVSGYKQTPGDIATQSWRCPACCHEWVAVETYASSSEKAD